jgi:hypothetical protein
MITSESSHHCQKFRPAPLPCEERSHACLQDLTLISGPMT